MKGASSVAGRSRQPQGEARGVTAGQGDDARLPGIALPPLTGNTSKQWGSRGHYHSRPGTARSPSAGWTRDVEQHGRNSSRSRRTRRESTSPKPETGYHKQPLANDGRHRPGDSGPSLGRKAGSSTTNPRRLRQLKQKRPRNPETTPWWALLGKPPPPGLAGHQTSAPRRVTGRVVLPQRDTLEVDTGDLEIDDDAEIESFMSAAAQTGTVTSSSALRHNESLDLLQHLRQWDVELLMRQKAPPNLDCGVDQTADSSVLNRLVSVSRLSPRGLSTHDRSLPVVRAVTADTLLYRRNEEWQTMRRIAPSGEVDGSAPSSGQQPPETEARPRRFSFPIDPARVNRDSVAPRHPLRPRRRSFSPVSRHVAARSIDADIPPTELNTVEWSPIQMPRLRLSRSRGRAALHVDEVANAMAEVALGNGENHRPEHIAHFPAFRGHVPKQNRDQSATVAPIPFFLPSAMVPSARSLEPWNEQSSLSLDDMSGRSFLSLSQESAEVEHSPMHDFSPIFLDPNLRLAPTGLNAGHSADPVLSVSTLPRVRIRICRDFSPDLRDPIPVSGYATLLDILEQPRRSGPFPPRRSEATSSARVDADREENGPTIEMERRFERRRGGPLPVRTSLSAKSCHRDATAKQTGRPIDVPGDRYVPDAEQSRKTMHDAPHSERQLRGTSDGGTSCVTETDSSTNESSTSPPFHQRPQQFVSSRGLILNWERHSVLIEADAARSMLCEVLPNELERPTPDPTKDSVFGESSQPLLRFPSPMSRRWRPASPATTTSGSSPSSPPLPADAEDRPDTPVQTKEPPKLFVPNEETEPGPPFRRARVIDPAGVAAPLLLRFALPTPGTQGARQQGLQTLSGSDLSRGTEERTLGWVAIVEGYHLEEDILEPPPLGYSPVHALWQPASARLLLWGHLGVSPHVVRGFLRRVRYKNKRGYDAAGGRRLFRATLAHRNGPAGSLGTDANLQNLDVGRMFGGQESQPFHGASQAASQNAQRPFAVGPPWAPGSAPQDGVQESQLHSEVELRFLHRPSQAIAHAMTKQGTEIGLRFPAYIQAWYGRLLFTWERMIAEVKLHEGRVITEDRLLGPLRDYGVKYASSYRFSAPHRSVAESETGTKSDTAGEHLEPAKEPTEAGGTSIELGPWMQSAESRPKWCALESSGREDGNQVLRLKPVVASRRKHQRHLTTQVEPVEGVLMREWSPLCRIQLTTAGYGDSTIYALAKAVSQVRFGNVAGVLIRPHDRVVQVQLVDQVWARNVQRQLEGSHWGYVSPRDTKDRTRFRGEDMDETLSSQIAEKSGGHSLNPASTMGDAQDDPLVRVSGWTDDGVSAEEIWEGQKQDSGKWSPVPKEFEEARLNDPEGLIPIIEAAIVQGGHAEERLEQLQQFARAAGMPMEEAMPTSGDPMILGASTAALVRATISMDFGRWDQGPATNWREERWLLEARRAARGTLEAMHAAKSKFDERIISLGRSSVTEDVPSNPEAEVVSESESIDDNRSRQRMPQLRRARSNSVTVRIRRPPLASMNASREHSYGAPDVVALDMRRWHDWFDTVWSTLRRETNLLETPHGLESFDSIERSNEESRKRLQERLGPIPLPSHLSPGGPHTESGSIVGDAASDRQKGRVHGIAPTTTRGRQRSPRLNERNSNQAVAPHDQAAVRLALTELRWARNVTAAWGKRQGNAANREMKGGPPSFQLSVGSAIIASPDTHGWYFAWLFLDNVSFRRDGVLRVEAIDREAVVVREGSALQVIGHESRARESDASFGTLTLWVDKGSLPTPWSAIFRVGPTTATSLFLRLPRVQPATPDREPWGVAIHWDHPEAYVRLRWDEGVRDRSNPPATVTDRAAVPVSAPPAHATVSAAAKHWNASTRLAGESQEENAQIRSLRRLSQQWEDSVLMTPATLEVVQVGNEEESNERDAKWAELLGKAKSRCDDTAFLVPGLLNPSSESSKQQVGRPGTAHRQSDAEHMMAKSETTSRIRARRASISVCEAIGRSSLLGNTVRTYRTTFRRQSRPSTARHSETGESMKKLLTQELPLFSEAEGQPRTPVIASRPAYEFIPDEPESSSSDDTSVNSNLWNPEWKMTARDNGRQRSRTSSVNDGRKLPRSSARTLYEAEGGRLMLQDMRRRAKAHRRGSHMDRKPPSDRSNSTAAFLAESKARRRWLRRALEETRRFPPGSQVSTMSCPAWHRQKTRKRRSRSRGRQRKRRAKKRSAVDLVLKKSSCRNGEGDAASWVSWSSDEEDDSSQTPTAQLVALLRRGTDDT